VSGPIGGTWRVRRILAPEHRSPQIPGVTYGEEAFVVRPGCDVEPCPTIEVAIAPLGRSSPVTTAVLRRDGDTYVSEASVENEGPCLNAFGDPIPGGTSVSSTLRLWITKVRPAGTAVESTVLAGAEALDMAPTPIGRAGGCQSQTAAYDLSGRREVIAVRTAPPSARPTDGSTAGRALTTLPRIDVKVAGATIDYFAIEGSTVDELAESLADGGVQACGAINYEWHEGDQRPAACAVTRFVDFDGSIRERTTADGTCSIADAAVTARFTIHFPRWTAPKRVPAVLLAWWRRIVDYIRDHEATHVRISLRYIKDLNADLDGAACDDASGIIRDWARALNRAQEAFDRTEYAKPWPAPPAGY